MTAAAPWLFSERDVRDLMRLKKPLFLDSRFLSAASCTLEEGVFTLGSLNNRKTTTLTENNQFMEQNVHTILVKVSVYLFLC